MSFVAPRRPRIVLFVLLTALVVTASGPFVPVEGRTVRQTLTQKGREKVAPVLREEVAFHERFSRP